MKPPKLEPPAPPPVRRISPTLRELLASRDPIILLQTNEESRGRTAIEQAVDDFQVQTHWWDCINGLDGKKSIKASGETVDGLDDILKALAYIRAQIKETGERLQIYVLIDTFHFLGNAKVQRLLRDLHRELQATRTSIVLLSAVSGLQHGLEHLISTIRLPLPDRPAMQTLVDEIIATEDFDKDAANVTEEAIDALMGLTWEQARLISRRSLACYEGKLHVPKLLRAKADIIQASGILELLTPKETLDDVGGYEILREWFNQRRKAFSKEGREFIGSAPKGVMLTGIPGVGKSLAAKAIGGSWQLPVLRLDMGKVFGSLIGQSEERIRHALELAEKVSPAVIWIDEIDKGAAGLASSGSSDGGTTSRVLGTLLTWMAEHNEPCFVVACVTGETRLLRQDGMVARIDSIGLRDVVCSSDVATGATTMAETDLIVRPTAKQARKVRTTTTDFTATPNHPVLVVGADGLVFKPTGQLVVGDRIARLRKLPEPTVTPLPLDDVPKQYPQEADVRIPVWLEEPLAELLGFLCADGSSYLRGRIAASDKHEQLADHVARRMQEAFGRVGRHTASTRNSHIVYLNSQRVLRWLHLNFPEMLEPKTAGRRVPAKIFRSRDTVVAAFLRGFFDGDGTCDARGVHVGLTNIDLATDVAHLLHRLGIGFTLSNAVARGKRLPVRVVHMTGRSDVQAFNAAVGFACDYKQARLQACCDRSLGKHRASELDTTQLPTTLLSEIVQKTELPAASFTYLSGRRRTGQDVALWVVAAWERTAAARLDASDPLLHKLRALQAYTWDRVMEIEDLQGPIPVFDVRIPGTRCYVGNGLVMHNTANDVTALPPELLRKGRLDEIFFLDLPSKTEREQIFRIHLAKPLRKGLLPLATYDLDELVAVSQGFSGSEIEQAVVDSLYMAFYEGVSVQQAHIVRALKQTVPLKETAAEKIEALREWAKTRARFASAEAAKEAGVKDNLVLDLSPISKAKPGVLRIRDEKVDN